MRLRIMVSGLRVGSGTPRTVGYVCSLIGLILGVLVCLLLVWLGAWSFGLFITLVERFL